MTASPLFNWLTERATGVLLHPSCFPGNQGIGTLNHSARNFIDFLSASEIKYWQVCPLGPTGFGDSPYQTFSAFAGNPYLIDLHELVGLDILSEKDMEAFNYMPASRSDFGALWETKWPILFKAYQAYSTEPSRWKKLTSEYTSFKKTHKAWLDSFALFMALKKQFGGVGWWEWPKDFKDNRKVDTKNLPDDTLNQIEAHKFYQFWFFKQWMNLKSYATDQGVEIIGDIPIFVALDSADVWQNPESFQLNKKTLLPKSVAGVPPDYFSEDGQLWGNPLYDWSVMKADSYNWWIDRFKISYELYDVVRLDHFRGFASYWSVPATADSAKNGKWIQGPGLDFFKAIKSAIPDAKIIAEDLGMLTPDVYKLMEETGLPGMYVLQFAFGGGNDNFYLPHNHHQNAIVYTGTHDNDTTHGWYDSIDSNTQDHARRYFDVSGENISWDLIRSSFKSPANLSIIPFQDLLSLGTEARMNEPGSALGNWQWRYQIWQLEKLRNESSPYLRELAELYHRETSKIRE